MPGLVVAGRAVGPCRLRRPVGVAQTFVWFRSGSRDAEKQGASLAAASAERGGADSAAAAAELVGQVQDDAST